MCSPPRGTRWWSGEPLPKGAILLEAAILPGAANLLEAAISPTGVVAPNFGLF